MIESHVAGMRPATGATTLASLFPRLLAWMNLMAAMIVVGLMLLITADVVSRAIFGFPFNGVPEITKLSLVTMLWLQTAHTLRQREHLRSTLILARLPAVGQRIVLLLNCMAGAAMMALIAWYGSEELTRAWRINAFEGEDPVRVPTWPIWAILAGGAALTAFEYSVQALRAVSSPEIGDELARQGVSFE